MRRRERVEPVGVRPEPPLWVRNLGAGLRHVNGRSPTDSITTDDLSRDLRRLREAQARWCAENGCHRQGKSCEEATGHRCERPAGSTRERSASQRESHRQEII